MSPEDKAAWTLAHEKVCDLGAVCSRHRPGFWLHLIYDTWEKAYAAGLDDAHDHARGLTAGRDNPFKEATS